MYKKYKTNVDKLGWLRGGIDCDGSNISYQLKVLNELNTPLSTAFNLFNISYPFIPSAHTTPIYFHYPIYPTLLLKMLFFR